MVRGNPAGGRKRTGACLYVLSRQDTRRYPMNQEIANYKSLIAEITEEVEAGYLTDRDKIQILRADKPIFQDYRPIVDWYYDAYMMQEELETPLEEMYMEDEFTKEEWAQMRQDHAAYKKQYEAEKPKLEEITIKAALTEMKQMQKLFK